eukprot:TRINITY_DN5310_c0_g1_i1.p1 TRINITY_DN5310_c0_g1~~TRINITY_DN5310_c0_g1_i1.p1  ORF type:complete len:523 (+),score=197.36 TRINITY_DN5310_c0_g1_i1:124-1692(+)
MREQTYGEYMEKQNMKMLVIENNQLKVRLQQAEEECRKKNKLLQELVPMDGSTPMVTQAHKEASLTISLKKRIRELEQENEGYKKRNETMAKNINSTKQSETKADNKAYEKECKRLRAMLEEAIINIHEDKSLNYPELETKIIEQRMAIKEQRKKIQELEAKLEEKKQSERRALEMAKKSEVQAQENDKQKEKIDQQKMSLERANERIAELENTVRLLEDRLSQARGEDYVYQPTEPNINTNEDLRTELDKALIDNENLKDKLEESEKKVFERDKEIREIRTTAKENEEAYILKSYEEQERLTKRIVKLELELIARRKEDAESGKKPIAPDEIRDIVKKAEMIYAKTWIKLILIRKKKSLEEFKEQLFSDFEPDETICIKELIKTLQKEPAVFDTATAELLSRYLIESREHPAIIYNKYNEKVVSEVKEAFDELMNLSYPPEFWKNEKEIINEGAKKAAEQYQYLRGGVGEGNMMSLPKWIQISNSICPELTSIERDYLISAMTDGYNLKQLDFGVTLALIL